MKKLLTIIITVFMSLGVNAKMYSPADSLKLYSRIVKSGDATTLMTHGNNNAAYHMNWPEPVKGIETPQAMLMINWQGLPIDDINDIIVSLDNGTPVSVQPQTQGAVQTWAFIPLGTKMVTLSHPRYGSVNIPLKTMSLHDIWTAPVILDQLVNIEVRPLTDYGRQIKVTLVNDEGDVQSAMSPARFENVMPGSYDLRFAVNGSNRDAHISVTPTHTIFTGENNKDLDFRNFKTITLESTDANSAIYVDGAYMGPNISTQVTLPYGPHTVSARVNEHRVDEKTIDVNQDSESTIYLSPTETKTFEVVGLYKGKPVETTVWVPGLPSDRYSSGTLARSHSFTLPATGSKSYRFTVEHAGHKGSKDISVTPGMAARQEIKINADRRMVWPWQREYYPADFGWEFSWVSKQYSTSASLYEDSDIRTTVKENGVWDNGFDHWLHGFRTGFHAQPTLKIGLGFYTGLFFEFYFSGSDQGIGDLDKYFEADISIPLHVLYQFPLGKKLSIGFHTGPTFNWAMHGVYYDKFLPDETDEDNIDDYTDFWSEDWAPNRVNFTWDFGLYIRWGYISISGTLARGMNDNKMHSEFGQDAKTVMNKRVLAFSIAF